MILLIFECFRAFYLFFRGRGGGVNNVIFPTKRDRYTVSQTDRQTDIQADRDRVSSLWLKFNVLVVFLFSFNTYNTKVTLYLSIYSYSDG